MLRIVIITMVSSLLLGIFGAIALTEAGQIIAMPRSWVFSFFQFKSQINVIIIALALASIALSFRHHLLKPKWLGLYSVAIVGTLFFINFFAPDVWLRSQHKNASFITIEEADKRLKPNEDMFVLEVNGDARAYPRDWMQLPHIVGDTIGGEDTVMTYCALSNLPLAFSPQVDGQSSNFKVIAQVHNNLIFADRESGELIQQVTATAEYSQSKLEQFPVQRMPWDSFKTLYPEGKVFDYHPTWFDKLTLALFDSALEPHYQGEPLFPTLDLTDERLPPEEQIWGVVDGDQSIAVTLESFSDKNQLVTQLNGKPLLFVYYPEYETVGAFWVDESSDWTTAKVSVKGTYDGGEWARANLYSGMPWMIWSHWFPESSLLK